MPRTNEQRQNLIKKLNRNVKDLTDRELTILRRSTHLNSENLFKVVQEQWRRGLLKEDSKVYGYLPEKLKRVSDYPEGQVSMRLPERQRKQYPR